MTRGRPRAAVVVACATALAALAACGGGGGRPADAATAAGVARLAVVLPARDALALVDPERGVVAEIGVGASPWGVAVSGPRAYVSTARHVAVVDLPQRRVIARVPYRTRIPAIERGEYRRGGMGIAVAPGGRRVYVGVHTGGRGRLEILDARRLTAAAAVRTGIRPFDVLADPGGKVVYTVDHDSYGVTRVEVRSRRTRAFRVAPLGSGAFDKLNYGALDARGRLLLPINGEVLAVLDPATGRVRRRSMRSRVHQAGTVRSGTRLLTIGSESLGEGRGPSLSVFDLRSGREQVIPLRRPHEDLVTSRSGRTAYLSGGYTRGGWPGITAVSLRTGRARELRLPAEPLGIARIVP